MEFGSSGQLWPVAEELLVRPLLPRPPFVTSRGSRRRAAFPCRSCGKAYQHHKNLLRHVRLECGKAPSNFCPHCPYSCKQPYNLTLHIRFKHSAAAAGPGQPDPLALALP
ncbi:hypothetical protein FOCC_FOCC005477 [Frankliniella occidentalis]|nr:hypothetical protein FOCC_FOCC005477 [Frankliniella occidentalis]